MGKVRPRILAITRDRHAAASRKLLGAVYWKGNVVRALQATTEIMDAIRADGWFESCTFPVPEATVRVLLLAFFFDASPTAVCKLGGVSRKDCRRVFDRMWASGILRADGLSVQWLDEEAGTIALMLDAMTIEGYVERTPDEVSRSPDSGSGAVPG